VPASSPRDRPTRRTRLASADLAAAWREQADAFVAWAREPHHDSYWRFHRDVFLELLPPPGRRTLDLGCGEGRLSRDLKRLGHSVVGVDLSPRMVDAAREADPEIEVHVADASELPFTAASFDCVVAFMSLQDVDPFERAIEEAARVLEPGGRFCVAIVHPLNSAGGFDGDAAGSPFVISGSYLDPSHYVDRFARDGLELELFSAHRPLQAYTEALTGAGFLIERLREPAVPEHGIQNPHSRRWQRLPLFLHLRALNP
jgi:SAM-dependent methyltransferase